MNLPRYRSLNDDSRLPRWVPWLLALVPLGGGGAAIARAARNVETITHAESTFVMRDSLTVYQQGQVLIHTRDSLIGEARAAQIDTQLVQLNGAAKQLLRACHRKGDCQ